MWSLFNTTMSASGWVCQRHSLMNNLRLVLTAAPNSASRSLSIWNGVYSSVLRSVLSFIHASIYLLHLKKVPVSFVVVVEIITSLTFCVNYVLFFSFNNHHHHHHHHHHRHRSPLPAQSPFHHQHHHHQQSD